MRFEETRLQGAFLIHLHPIADDRGSFTRTFAADELRSRGLQADVAQENVSWTRRRGSIRGLHFQYPPHAETKLVRCSRGAMLDVIVDLRPESPTYMQHVSVELRADEPRALYIPERFAHGFQTLADDTETTYLMGAPYRPEAAGGILFSDPRLEIVWPFPPADVSARDQEWPLLDGWEAELRARMAP